MDETYDVIVVGGGPSGATAADDLARRGANGNILQEVWQVEEILTRQALAEEGRAIIKAHESDMLISQPTMRDAAKRVVQLAGA